MAKTHKNIYPEIYSFEALYNGCLRARRGKRYNPEVLRFSERLEENLITLQNELIWHMYETGRYHTFYIYEPKKRMVAALPFRDRVVQHAAVAALTPIFEARFIADSYACRVGKGTHAGADRAQHLLRKVQRRQGRVYVFKADIHHYFASVNHTILKGLLRQRIADPDTLWLLNQIIDSVPGPAGIPIGNLTSQLFANIYLHALDEFVKYELREIDYIRYMDDFIIIHHNKNHLREIRPQVECFLDRELKLALNDKTQVFPVARHHGRALDFLGYKIWPTHRRLRKGSVCRMRRKIALAKKGLFAEASLKRSLASWTGHASHADTYTLQNKITAEAAAAGRESADIRNQRRKLKMETAL